MPRRVKRLCSLPASQKSPTNTVIVKTIEIDDDFVDRGQGLSGLTSEQQSCPKTRGSQASSSCYQSSPKKLDQIQSTLPRTEQIPRDIFLCPNINEPQPKNDKGKPPLSQRAVAPRTAWHESTTHYSSPSPKKPPRALKGSGR